MSLGGHDWPPKLVPAPSSRPAGGARGPLPTFSDRPKSQSKGTRRRGSRQLPPSERTLVRVPSLSSDISDSLDGEEPVAASEPELVDDLDLRLSLPAHGMSSATVGSAAGQLWVANRKLGLSGGLNMSTSRLPTRKKQTVRIGSSHRSLGRSLRDDRTGTSFTALMPRLVSPGEHDAYDTSSSSSVSESSSEEEDFSSAEVTRRAVSPNDAFLHVSEDTAIGSSFPSTQSFSSADSGIGKENVVEVRSRSISNSIPVPASGSHHLRDEVYLDVVAESPEGIGSVDEEKPGPSPPQESSTHGDEQSGAAKNEDEKKELMLDDLPVLLDLLPGEQTSVRVEPVGFRDVTDGTTFVHRGVLILTNFRMAFSTRRVTINDADLPAQLQDPVSEAARLHWLAIRNDRPPYRASVPLFSVVSLSRDHLGYGGSRLPTTHRLTLRTRDVRCIEILFSPALASACHFVQALLSRTLREASGSLLQAHPGNDDGNVPSVLSFATRYWAEHKKEIEAIETALHACDHGPVPSSSSLTDHTGKHNPTDVDLGQAHTSDFVVSVDDEWTSFDRWRAYSPSVEFHRMGIGFSDEPDYAQCEWIMTESNKEYQLCSSYPSLIVVPRMLSSSDLCAAASYRTKNRLPVLTWRDPETGVSLLRSSQPRAGLGGKLNEVDTLLLDAARTAGKHKKSDDDCTLFIVDARPKINAVGNRLAGAGYEDARYYRGTSLQFAEIENIHEVRDSFMKLASLIETVHHGQAAETHSKQTGSMAHTQRLLGSTQISTAAQTSREWLSGLGNSGWLYHSHKILAAVATIVEKLVKKQSNVLVHCSDGWDRTGQLCALAQLCIDPYYRTLEGFAVLIEKDMLSFGHRFGERTFGWCDPQTEKSTEHSSCDHADMTDYEIAGEMGSGGELRARRKNSHGHFPHASHLPNGLERKRSDSSEKVPSAEMRESKKSPIFLQFLDCVWQLKRQYAQAFEFSEEFLTFVADAMHEARFGTFLLNNEYQRTKLKFEAKTQSIWHALGLSCTKSGSNHVPASFLDPLYDPHRYGRHHRGGAGRVIFPVTDVRAIRLWEGFFLRWDHDLRKHRRVYSRGVREVAIENDRLRKEIELLRSALATTATPSSSPRSESLGKSRSRPGRSALTRTATDALVVRPLAADTPPGGSPQFGSGSASKRARGDSGGLQLQRRAAGAPDDLSSKMDATETPLNQQPQWTPDVLAPNCFDCASSFSFFNRRHHCRNCGGVFCGNCSSERSSIPQMRYYSPVRVCIACKKVLLREEFWEEAAHKVVFQVSRKALQEQLVSLHFGDEETEELNLQ